jgi:hypothetical protein
MKKLLLASFLMLSGYCGLNAQTQTAATPEVAAKTKAFAVEVYQTYTVYTSPAQLAAYQQILDRIEVKSLQVTANENYTPLSTVALKDKYNPALVRDNASTFNPSNFNALKYMFELFPKQDKIYRVDGTQYVIVIHPVH